MSSPRLKTQFEKLYDHFNGQDSHVQLEDVISVLFCTRRNARIVLNKMAEEGWLEWYPAAGRGNLSKIVFKRSQHDVSETLAKQYLEQGKVEQAFHVLNKDSAKLTKVIENYLGVNHEEGQQIIRLPYYRPLSMLNPTKPHRRSEQNIIRQIFSGLTTLDENDQLKPDLAHNWESNDGRLWRFFIRPGVRFHNGDLLTLSHVVESVTALSKNRLFEHIVTVKETQAWVLEVELNRDDWHFPLLLTESCAKIVPPSAWDISDFDQLPIGTGPFQVKKNTEKKLVLEAFDNYFGYRPLLDRVEVWVIDELYSSIVFPTLSYPIKSKVSSNDEVKLDPGCTYLLLNRKEGVAKDEKWARYFSASLSAHNLFQQLQEETIIELGLLAAYGLKPGWHHTALNKNKIAPPEQRRISIAYLAHHPVFPEMVKAIARILQKDGLSLEFIEYQHAPEDTSQIDIWLKPMGIGTERDDALAAWLLNYSSICELSPPALFENWSNLVDRWRSEKGGLFPARDLGKSLVESYQIIPLFHCWLGVSKEQCGTLQNATCNSLGWFDFCKVWVKPK